MSEPVATFPFIWGAGKETWWQEKLLPVFVWKIRGKNWKTNWKILVCWDVLPMQRSMFIKTWKKALHIKQHSCIRIVFTKLALFISLFSRQSKPVGCADPLWVWGRLSWFGMESFTPVQLKLNVLSPACSSMKFYASITPTKKLLSLPLQLNVIIRSLLQNLQEKIDQLKDLLLRAVSTHQMYLCKHQLADLSGLWKRVEKIGCNCSATQFGFFPHSIFRLCY